MHQLVEVRKLLVRAKCDHLLHTAVVARWVDNAKLVFAFFELLDDGHRERRLACPRVTADQNVLAVGGKLDVAVLLIFAQRQTMPQQPRLPGSQIVGRDLV